MAKYFQVISNNYYKIFSNRDNLKANGGSFSMNKPIYSSKWQFALL